MFPTPPVCACREAGALLAASFYSIKTKVSLQIPLKWHDLPEARTCPVKRTEGKQERTEQYRSLQTEAKSNAILD